MARVGLRMATLASAAVLSACSEPVDTGVRSNGASNGVAAPGAPAAPTPAPAPAPASDAPALAIDGDGLRLFNRDTGAARPLPFGLPRADLLAALVARGKPATGRQEECGAGPLGFATWPDGLKLYFQSGTFAGWAVDQRAARVGGLPAIATAAGIGPGSTRAQVEDAVTITVTRSTLGTEFQSGAISGLFDGPAPTSVVTAMWAGASCNFR